MSEAKRFSREDLWAYAAVALVVAIELVVLWRALNPGAGGEYRAYYIDKTTTCLPQPMTGEYKIGRIVSFRPDGVEAALELKPCGWEGPAGDGTHSVGETSRLRFAVDPDAPPLDLVLELVAVDLPGPALQRVRVSANGEGLGEISVPRDPARRVSLPIPAAALAGRTVVDIALDFPDAVRAYPGAPDTRKRAIKLLAAGLVPAER
ncbi:hypothetical protein VE25_20785 [Devosia geojensis]|uniref:Uncharacterized protein n=1 Tax=Devosia geojensis TaxID=443610 RepID=A0A0F5FDA3_9HYPH|nr:hypothetical protein [Devosia geojensis]KKB06904.1 hypothetical protein VE25_20785 [Devosia geojensis]